MSNHEILPELDQILRHLADELDVPPSKYREAKERYEAVGAWLGAVDSDLARYSPLIYPQGSFALGTAVKPLGEEEYDVDAVCLLNLDTSQATQQQLKEMVGARLKHPASRYRLMIEPPEGGRRCWTIKYAEESRFHLDVLPSVPDDYDWLIALGVPEEWARHAIRITDRKTWNTAGPWPASNPRGYVEWFKWRMAERMRLAKIQLAMEQRAEIEEIEDFAVRTPLQQLVQLLKRHRDIRYSGDEDRPISVIITTLAAEAYQNEAGLAETVLAVVPRMRALVRQQYGRWWIPNPVNPRENFADKWKEKPQKAKIFIEWLESVERDHSALLRPDRFEAIGPALGKWYGEKAASAALASYSRTRITGGNLRTAAPIVLVPPSLPGGGGSPARPKVELPSAPSKPWGHRGSE